MTSASYRKIRLRVDEPTDNGGGRLPVHDYRRLTSWVKPSRAVGRSTRVENWVAVSDKGSPIIR
jgi:hypothetical protein